ncbi:MAG TPA: aminomethyl-transferring glycine dehydrogenase subunit GcvPA [Jiangellales bacterium]|nr:aminomethyl-transferring glycine dehydrogenase subunit GcvPA [Jiangellales bacterium]
MIHPYIPNSVPQIKQAMLETIGLTSAEELYRGIPADLRLGRPLKLPEPCGSEAELVRHVRTLLSRNVSTQDRLCFLGAGTFPHYVPAVVDEVINRGEFLTAYAGEPYEDHGRFQALFEYASQMAELLEQDVVNVPVYDGYQAVSTALLMTTRITARRGIVIASPISPDKFRRIVDYLGPHADLVVVAPDPATGQVDVDAVRACCGEDTAGVYLETPDYHGVVQEHVTAVSELVHAVGAELVVGTDPITLGVLKAPATLGADIVCGDIQSLGIHQWFGGGHGGFIAVADDVKYVMELPSRLFGLAATDVPGEYGFGDVAYERTSFAVREEGKEWVGTAAALWGIAAGVYLSLMGPQGMAELGGSVLARTRYAMERIAAIPGVRVEASSSVHFREFVVDVAGTGRSAADIVAVARAQHVEPGVVLDGSRLLTCVTEIHSRADIDRLVDVLTESGAAR